MSNETMATTAKQKKGIIITVVSILVVITVFMTLFLNKMFSPRILSHEELLVNGAVEFKTPRIVKPFELIDHQGNVFDNARLKDKWTLMFFGFTTCPDICPTTLATLSRFVKTLDEDIRDKTQVVLVTVDPERDTQEKLNQYIEFFHEDFVGVTGEFLTIRRLTENVNVAFNKVMLDDDYTVDHSGHIVLLNPYGDYHGLFKPPFELAKLKLTYQSIVTQFKH